MVEGQDDIFSNINKILFDDKNIKVIEKVVSGPVQDILQMTTKQVGDALIALVSSGFDSTELAKLLGVSLIEHSRDPVMLATRIIALRQEHLK